MFGGELVRPTMPDRAGRPPLVRDVSGPGPHTQGIIAKQPGSSWLRRKQLLDKRHTEEIKNVTLGGMKNMVKIMRQRKFEQKTDRRNFFSRLQVGVNDGLIAAQEDLQQRRNELRDILLREETQYTREYVGKSLSVKSERIEEVKKRIEEVRLINEAEDRRFVEEKRFQQYKARCEDLRNKISQYNRQQLKEVHLKQMEENVAKKAAERERDEMYYQLMVKDLEAMEEYEKRRNQIEKSLEQKEIADVYEKTLEAKRAMAEEEKRIKSEEAKLIKMLEEELKRERKQEREVKAKARYQMRKEVLEQVKQSRELLEWKKKQENEMDRAFCKLIQDEINKEKKQQTDTKRQNRRELESFQAHLNKMKEEQLQEEKETDKLRMIDLQKIYNIREEIRCNEKQAKQKLLEEVIQIQGSQMEEKSKRLQEEYEQKKIEDALELEECEKFKQEKQNFLQDQKMKRLLYAKELKDHAEAVKIIREKEKADEEARCKAEIMAEEEYFRKLHVNVASCDKKHPFYKIFEGTANRT